jgi:hypothetical protein
MCNKVTEKKLESITLVIAFGNVIEKLKYVICNLKIEIKLEFH